MTFAVDQFDALDGPLTFRDRLRLAPTNFLLKMKCAACAA